MQAWLKRHPRFVCHFVPTSASWLNLAERWFRELTDKATRRGSFVSVPDWKRAIDDFIHGWNQAPNPFVWTATVDQIIEKIARASQDGADQPWIDPPQRQKACRVKSFPRHYTGIRVVQDALRHAQLLPDCGPLESPVSPRYGMARCSRGSQTTCAPAPSPALSVGDASAGEGARPAPRKWRSLLVWGSWRSPSRLECPPRIRRPGAAGYVQPVPAACLWQRVPPCDADPGVFGGLGRLDDGDAAIRGRCQPARARR